MLSNSMISEKNKGSLTEKTVRAISERFNEPEWLLEKRLKAFSSISGPILDKFSYGLGINIDARSFNLESFDYSSLNKNPLKAEAHDGVIISDLHKAPETHEDVIKKYMFSTEKLSNNLSSLQLAFWSSGIFIYVPEGAEVSVPISWQSTQSGQTFLENTLIVAEPFSKLTLIEVSDSINSQAPAFRSQNLELFANESSKIEFCCIQNSGENVFSLSDRNAIAEKDSSINWIICDIGGGTTKSDVTTQLKGEGSSVKNIGLFLGKNKQQFDFSVTAVHQSPHTFSDMLTKGALSGSSKAIYRGYIKIKNTAPKSSGYQKADILLLSKDAEADPIPNLEIDNNDIEKCTHGATVGQIDKEKLFYMMSRGLTEKEAIKQIVAGLFSPAMDRIKIDSIKNSLVEILDKRLEDL